MIYKAFINVDLINETLLTFVEYKKKLGVSDVLVKFKIGLHDCTHVHMEAFQFKIKVIDLIQSCKTFFQKLFFIKVRKPFFIKV